MAYASQSDWAHAQLLAVRLPWPHRTLAQAIGRLPQAASGACPGHRALAPARIGRLSMATPGRTPGIYLRCVDWAHSQSLWPGALPGRTGRTPGIYASYATGRTPSPTLLGFQLYAISGRAHFRHRPMQLRAIHRGWAHSQAFGGNVSAFNANATSQASTRFAQLVWPHGYCWYPPKVRKKHLSSSTASLKVCKLTVLLSLFKRVL